MYIVIFNVNSADPEPLTNSHGFLKEFWDNLAAAEEADEWLDEDQYRYYKIYQQLD